MTIAVDREYQVSQRAYIAITTAMSGIVAHRQENNRYYIKVWVAKYLPDVQRVIDRYPLQTSTNT